MIHPMWRGTHIRQALNLRMPSLYSPEETLDNVFNIAERFMRDARVIRAMIAEGKDRKLGISMGHHTLLEKFESGNEHHLTLLRLHNDLAQLKVYLAREGVLMTQEETEERLRVMEEKGEINPPSLDKLYR